MSTRSAGWTRWVTVALLATTGCRAVLQTAVVGAALVVGTAGFVGYGVYKGGAAIVSGVGSAGSAVAGTVKKGHKAVVISRGTLKAQFEHEIAEIHPAAIAVMRESGFTRITGDHDALQGSIQARTSSGDEVLVNLTLVEKGLTAVKIRIGDGNLKQSEYLYDEILARINAEDGGDES